MPFQALVDTKRALNMHLDRAVLNVLDYALVTEDRSFTSDDTRSFLAKALKKEQQD